MFAMVAVAGFRLVVSDGFNARNEMILALTLAFGLGVTFVPEAFASIAEFAREDGFTHSVLQSTSILLQSGLMVGAATATLLNLLLPPTSRFDDES